MSKENNDINKNNVPQNAEDWRAAKERLEYEVLLEQTSAAKAERDYALHARKVNAEREEKSRLVRLARQQHCRHLKPNGSTAFSGQGIGEGRRLYICAYCHGEFDDKTFPAWGIKPDLATYGGVHY